MIHARLSIPYPADTSRNRAAIHLLNNLGGCRLSFDNLQFKDDRMFVEVFLYDSNIEPLDQPRFEDEATALIKREVDKAGLNASILVLHGTAYADEQKVKP